MLTRIKPLATVGCAFVTIFVCWCVLFDAGPVQAQVVNPPLIISEFRVRGPNGANDEFIEIYNNSAGAFTVAGGGGGFAVAASDGVARCVIPNGTVIPNRGHYLCTNSVSYSLAGNATGDATYTTDIPDNAGIALFNTSVAVNFTLANRLDAVGSTSEANTLYREGAGYPTLMPFSIDYSLTRRVPGGCTGSGGGGNCTTVTLNQITGAPTSPDPQDTNNNTADFIFADTNGSAVGAGQRLGAAGPENLASPTRSNLPGGPGLVASELDPLVAITAPPNLVRDFTSDPPNNSTFGTISIRRTITNNTGAPITRLRFRVTDISTFPAIAGVADLRVRTSSDIFVGPVLVRGTTLDQPPSQPNGGGYNSTLSVPSVTAGNPLAAGASVNVQVLLGIQQTGVERLELDVPIRFILPADMISGRLTNNNGVGLANVAVTLSGTLTRVVVTDAGGNYFFNNLTPGGSYTVTARSPYFAFTPPGATVATLTSNQVADFVAPLGAPPTNFVALSDNFEGTTRDPNKWNLGTLTQPQGAFDPAVIVEQQTFEPPNRALVITPRANADGPHFNGYVSVVASDLTNGTASVELKQAGLGGAVAAFAVGEDSNNFYRFVVAGPATPVAALRRLLLSDATLTETRLFFQIRIGGVLTQESIEYKADEHHFLRFRHDAPLNSINFETSREGTMWEPRRRFGPLQKGVSALACELSAGTASAETAPGQVVFDNFQLTTNTLQFNVDVRSVGEGEGSAVFTVTRRGSLNTPALVRYEAVSRTASSRSDFLDAFGTLRFAPGEAAQTFNVLVTDDALVEGPETFDVFLSVPNGAGLDAPARAIVTINDNDVMSDVPNPIDETTFFVTQQYRDFLNRDPDKGGLDFWSGGIESCGPIAQSAQCREVKRIDTSAAFFLSIEFQETGVLVYRMYKAAYGDIAGLPVPVRLREFTEDSQLIGRGVRVGIGDWEEQLRNNKSAYAAEFVARARFTSAHSETTPPAVFVGDLNRNAGFALSPTEQNALVMGLENGTLTRGQVLRAVAEDSDFAAAEFRRAFVLMQYFGYLRRDPDAPDFQNNPDPQFLGYNFWLTKLNQFNGNYVDAEMVRAFISSIEYRNRFGR